MSKLTEGALAKIRYRKDDGDETTERTIVPVTIPSNIRALDVSDLSEAHQEIVAKLSGEYQAYLKRHMKRAFSLEMWSSKCKGFDLEPKWRTFKPENTDVL